MVAVRICRIPNRSPRKNTAVQRISRIGDSIRLPLFRRRRYRGRIAVIGSPSHFAEKSIGFAATGDDTGTVTCVREAVEADIPVLREIERAAGEPFARVGMIEIAEDEPPSVEALRGYLEAGRAWVVEEDGAVVAYLVADLIDGNAHIDQVSVRPELRGRGLGKLLIDRLVAWARERGLAAITLTTFTEVPWNGPYYARIGFRQLPPEERTPGLRAVCAAEAAHGLERWPRTCMRAEVSAWQAG
ncbi:MAG TPA: GNAT family N-acetyltransferase [Nocardia sp.]|nr:GNAT family N-acetyltransferase [Nocardia sp.]HLS79046.1 GNAT family N-acetyltransferase [Nocardia sp.]